MPECDAPALEQDIAKHFADKVVRTRITKRRQPAQAEVQPSQPVAQASSSSRGLRPITGMVFSIGQARSLMPKAKGTSIAIHSGRAWQVKYLATVAGGAKSHTETWGPDRSHRMCLLLCLEWAWRRHTEATSESCPWDMGELKP